MSITYPLTMPSWQFQRFALTEFVNAAASESTFTAQQQLYLHQGEGWQAEVTLPPLARADAEAWRAFFSALRGRYGTFLLGDPLGRNPQGAAGATAQVGGGWAAGSTSLGITSLTPNTSKIFKAGDYVQAGTGASQRLYRILADADSDSFGSCTVDIFPRLREALVSLSSLTLRSCAGTFRLAKPPTIDTDNQKLFYIAFSAVEAI